MKYIVLILSAILMTGCAAMLGSPILAALPVASLGGAFLTKTSVEVEIKDAPKEALQNLAKRTVVLVTDPSGEIDFANSLETHLDKIVQIERGGTNLSNSEKRARLIGSCKKDSVSVQLRSNGGAGTSIAGTAARSVFLGQQQGSLGVELDVVDCALRKVSTISANFTITSSDAVNVDKIQLSKMLSDSFVIELKKIMATGATK